NARGYPPSDVPESLSAYSQTHAADDIKTVLDHLAIDRAHIIGLSVGGFDEAEYSIRRAHAHGELLPHNQSRGTRRLQPHCGRLYSPGRQRPLADARPAGNKQLDHRNETLKPLG